MAARTSKNGKAASAAAVKDRPERQALRAAAEYAADSSFEIRKTTLTLSNGIVLRIKPVPQMLLRDATLKIATPKVPMWHNDQRDEDEPNPNDPSYLEAMQEYNTAVMLTAGNAALVLGTECLTVPVGYSRPEDEEWLEYARYANAEPDVSSKPARYVAWLHYHALNTETDQAAAIMAPLLAASLTDEEVDRVVSAFRSRAERRPDSAGGASEPDQHGDHVPDAGAGDSAGDRGAGGSDLLGPDVAAVVGDLTAGANP